MSNKLFSFYYEKHFYYFLIFWAIHLIITLFRLIPNEFFEIKMSFDNLDSNKEKLENAKINELINLVWQIFAELLGGMAYLCYNESILENINKDKKKILYLMIISICYFIYRLRNFLYYLLSQCAEKLRNNEVNLGIGLSIIFTIIFLKYINKEIIFYFHHKVSIAITLIAFFLMSSTDIYSIINQDKGIQMSNKLIYLIINAFHSIFFPLSYSLYKILMNNYLSPLSLIFINGIFETILLMIILPILFFTKIIKIGKIDFDSVLFIFWILIKICYIIFYFIRLFIILKIIK